MEIEHWAYWVVKIINWQFDLAGEERKLQLCEVEEMGIEFYNYVVVYKEMMKRIHDMGIWGKTFQIGQTVLVFNSQLNFMLEKLKV